MSFLYENTMMKERIESLPEGIKTKVLNNASEIKSLSELEELVRRIRSAETGKIF
ncbi:MAG: hypothetical protein MJ120_02375 [Clostridia bacterium]|nr:hypothetical protein [Clostridia bacterium]